MFEELVGASPNFVSWKNNIHGKAPNPNHLYFTSEWPNKWVTGKFFEIISVPKIIDHVRSYKLPGEDYKELDLSNSSSGLKLYPDSENQVNEILVGFKPGNYVVQIDVPNGSPLGTLSDATMIPSKTDSTLKYLNAKNPEDSPAFNPTLKFWAIKDMDAIVLRPIVLSGVQFEKVTFTFKIARHKITEIPRPNTAFDTITHIREDRW